MGSYVTPSYSLLAAVLLATLRPFPALAQSYQEHYKFKNKIILDGKIDNLVYNVSEACACVGWATTAFEFIQ
jgi:hypothetical protein